MACGRTRNFLRLLADRILIFLRVEVLADKAQFNLHVLAAQELLAPLLARALFLDCTVQIICKKLNGNGSSFLSSFQKESTNNNAGQGSKLRLTQCFQ